MLTPVASEGMEPARQSLLPWTPEALQGAERKACLHTLRTADPARLNSHQYVLPAQVGSVAQLCSIEWRPHLFRRSGRTGTNSKKTIHRESGTAASRTCLDERREA